MAGRVLAQPNQTPGLLDDVGLTRAQADHAAWAIDRDGKAYGGAAAINRVLAELGGLWGPATWLYRLPPLRWLEDRGYRWVAEHRSRL